MITAPFLVSSSVVTPVYAEVSKETYFRGQRTLLRVSWSVVTPELESENLFSSESFLFTAVPPGPYFLKKKFSKVSALVHTCTLLLLI